MIKKTVLYMLTIYLLCMSVAFGESPDFNVGRKQTIPDLVAGEDNHVSIRFINDSRESVIKLEISPQFDNELEFPFIIDEMTTVRTKHGIRSKGTFDLPFVFNVKKTAKAGKFPFKLNLEYTSSDGSKGSQTITLYLNIVNTLDQPQLTAKSIVVENGVLTHGVEQTVKFEMKNTSDVAIQQMTFKFKDLSTSTVQIAGSQTEAKIQTLEPDASETVKFTMIGGSDLKGPYQTVTGVLTYIDEYAKTYEQEMALQIPAEDASNYDANLKLGQIQIPTSGVNGGDEFPVSFNLINEDVANLKNVTVKIEGNSDIYTKSTPTVHFRTMDSGVTHPVNFVLDSKSDIEAKTHSLKVLVNYDIAGKTREYYEYISVPVVHSGGNLSPKLILTDYNIKKEQVFAGESFPVDFTFTNTSKSKEVYNVKVTISSTEDTFTPVESSNVFFIDKLNAKQNILKTLSLKADYNAKPQNHAIDVKMEYEDKEGKQYTTSDTVSVPVWQELKPRISKIQKPDFIEANMPTNISFDIYNIGKAQLRNIFVEVVGDNVVDQQGETYLGNLSEGSDTYFDGAVLFTAEGEQKATVIIKYQDDAGNEFRETKDIIANVEPAMVYDEAFPPGFEEGANEYETGMGMMSWVKWGIGFVVLVGLIIGIVIFIKKRKARKQVEQYDPLG